MSLQYRMVHNFIIVFSNYGTLVCDNHEIMNNQETRINVAICVLWCVDQALQYGKLIDLTVSCELFLSMFDPTVL